MGTNRGTTGEHLLPFGLECPEVGAEVEVEFAGPKGTYVSVGKVTSASGQVWGENRSFVVHFDSDGTDYTLKVGEERFRVRQADGAAARRAGGRVRKKVATFDPDAEASKPQWGGKAQPEEDSGAEEVEAKASPFDFVEPGDADQNGAEASPPGGFRAAAEHTPQLLGKQDAGGDDGLMAEKPPNSVASSAPCRDDPYERVTLWNKKKKCKMAGRSAPTRANLQSYLLQHPECEVYTDDGGDGLMAEEPPNSVASVVSASSVAVVKSWTPEADEWIVNYIEKHGNQKLAWEALTKLYAGQRSQSSLRSRWYKLVQEKKKAVAAAKAKAKAAAPVTLKQPVDSSPTLSTAASPLADAVKESDEQTPENGNDAARRSARAPKPKRSKDAPEILATKDTDELLTPQDGTVDKAPGAAGVWSAEEIELLRQIVARDGTGDWGGKASEMSAAMSGFSRSGNSLQKKYKELGGYQSESAPSDDDCPLSKYAAASAEPAAAASRGDPDERVTLWNNKKKCKVAGRSAPTRANLQDYLLQHPECEVYTDQTRASPAPAVRVQQIEPSKAGKRDLAKKDWTAEEEAMLLRLIERDGAGNYELKAQQLGTGRTFAAIQSKKQELLGSKSNGANPNGRLLLPADVRAKADAHLSDVWAKVGASNGLWSDQEWKMLRRLVARDGEGNWAEKAAVLGRTTKSVQNKWDREKERESHAQPSQTTSGDPRIWSDLEYESLRRLVEKDGIGKWELKAQALGSMGFSSRTGTSIERKWRRESDKVKDAGAGEKKKPQPASVGEGWTVEWSAEYSDWFYWHAETQVTQWERPTLPSMHPSDNPLVAQLTKGARLEAQWEGKWFRGWVNAQHAGSDGGTVDIFYDEGSMEHGLKLLVDGRPNPDLRPLYGRTSAATLDLSPYTCPTNKVYAEAISHAVTEVVESLVTGAEKQPSLQLTLATERKSNGGDAAFKIAEDSEEEADDTDVAAQLAALQHPAKQVLYSEGDDDGKGYFRSSNKEWTEEEFARLEQLVQAHGTTRAAFDTIASELGTGRSAGALAIRWRSEQKHEPAGSTQMVQSQADVQEGADQISDRNQFAWRFFTDLVAGQTRKYVNAGPGSCVMAVELAPAFQSNATTTISELVGTIKDHHGCGWYLLDPPCPSVAPNGFAPNVLQTASLAEAQRRLWSIREGKGKLERITADARDHDQRDPTYESLTVRDLGIPDRERWFRAVMYTYQPPDDYEREEYDKLCSGAKLVCVYKEDVVALASEALVAARTADGKPSSMYEGVSWDDSKRKWWAYHEQDRRFTHLGTYSSEEAAANAVQAFLLRSDSQAPLAPQPVDTGMLLEQARRRVDKIKRTPRGEKGGAAPKPKPAKRKHAGKGPDAPAAKVSAQAGTEGRPSKAAKAGSPRITREHSIVARRIVAKYLDLNVPMKEQTDASFSKTEKSLIVEEINEALHAANLSPIYTVSKLENFVKNEHYKASCRARNYIPDSWEKRRAEGNKNLPAYIRGTSQEDDGFKAGFEAGAAAAKGLRPAAAAATAAIAPPSTSGALKGAMADGLGASVLANFAQESETEDSKEKGAPPAMMGERLPQVDGLTGLAINQPRVQASDLPPSARDSAESLLSVASGDESEEEQQPKRKPPGLAAAETAVQGDKENAVNGSPAKRLKVIGGVAVRPCVLQCFCIR